MRAGPTWRTPRARVRALGASGHGASHWLAERLTSVALVPLGLWAVWAVLRVASGPSRGYSSAYVAATDLLHNPIHAVMAVLFLAVSVQHMHAGMRVIIEDYVPEHNQRIAWLLVNAGVCLIVGALAVFSVLKTALGAGH